MISPPSKIYEAELDLTQDNDSHTLAIRRFLEFAAGKRRRVLEVGCATGYLGEQLCLRGHQVTGVEPCPAAAEAAGARLSRVENCSIEQYLAGCEERFDCVVFGDVLEHLIDPRNVLERSSRLLEPEGIVIACIPNVAHLSVRLMLLEGRWDYGELGILDNTHLRFFNRDTVLSLMRDSGLAVRTMDRTYSPVDNGLIRVNSALQHQVGPFVHDDEQLTFQFLVTADRRNSDQARDIATSSSQSIRVLALMPSIDWTAGDIRIRRPLMEWQSRYGGAARFKTPETCSPEDIAWSDVIVVQRIAEPSMRRRIQQLRAKGKKVLFELDDLLTEVPLFLATGHYYEVVRPDLEAILRMVDRVVVSTSMLAERLSHYNAGIHVIPNAVSEALFQASHNDSDPVHLIVASSDSVLVDFIVPALREITDRYDNTRIVAIGPPADALAAAGLVLIRSGNLSYPEFGRYISGWTNPVGIIPLDDSIFSSCKSPIKYLDYSSHGIPVLASNVAPHADVIEHGVTGLLIDNETRDWIEGIESLLTDVAKRSAIASEARDLVRKNFTMVRSAALWNETITQLLSENAKADAADTITLLNRQLPTGEAGRISAWMEANFGSGAANDVTAFHTTPSTDWEPQHIDAVGYLQEGNELAFVAEDGSMSIQGFTTFNANEDIIALRHGDGGVHGVFFRSDSAEWVELGKVTRVATRVATINQEFSEHRTRTRLSRVLTDLHPGIDLSALHAVTAFPKPKWAPEHLEAVNHLLENVARVLVTNRDGAMQLCSFDGFDPTEDIMAIADDSGAVQGVFFRARDDTWVELGELAEVVHPHWGRAWSNWLYSRFLHPRSYLSLLKILARSGPRGVATHLRNMGVLR